MPFGIKSETIRSAFYAPFLSMLILSIVFTILTPMRHETPEIYIDPAIPEEYNRFSSGGELLFFALLIAYFAITLPTTMLLTMAFGFNIDYLNKKYGRMNILYHILLAIIYSLSAIIIQFVFKILTSAWIVAASILIFWLLRRPDRNRHG